VLPVIIFVCVAIPLLILAFIGIHRSKRSTEQLAAASGVDEAELEREFAAEEAYEEQLRKAQHGHSHDGHA
jgi:hypothetical protein